MKKLTTILAVLVSLTISTSVMGWGDNLTKREKHDREYAENKAAVERYKPQCYQGNKRACKILIYSADQVERYKITYPEGKQ